MTDRALSEWFAIEITAAPQAAEALEFLFNQLDSLGTEIQEFHRNADEPVTVTGYFEVPPNAQLLQRELESSLNAYELSDDVIMSIQHRTIENADWLSEWKKHWRPTHVGRFIVAPSWERPDKRTQDVLIRIEPNMAFGTGTHETTRLCLQAIDEHFRPGMSFLDVGTGTGILAIAAAKLNKAHASVRDSLGPNFSPGPILGLDTDADAIEIARENARTNDVCELLEFQQGTLTDKSARFDYVCANLTADVIVSLLPLLLEKTLYILVLSGILREQEAIISSAISRCGSYTPNVSMSGDWVSMTVTMNDNSGTTFYSP